MFKRLSNLIKGFFGLFVSGMEKRNPEALLEVEKENLRAQIAEFNKGLAAHAGLVEKLISRVKKLDKQETELRAKTAANLKAGNREAAGKLALQLKAIDSEHDDVRSLIWRSPNLRLRKGSNLNLLLPNLLQLSLARPPWGPKANRLLRKVGQCSIS